MVPRGARSNGMSYWQRREAEERERRRRPLSTAEERNMAADGSNGGVVGGSSDGDGNGGGGSGGGATGSEGNGHGQWEDEKEEVLCRAVGGGRLCSASSVLVVPTRRVDVVFCFCGPSINQPGKVFGHRYLPVSNGSVSRFSGEELLYLRWRLRQNRC